jgi:hypothetical protein
LGGIVVIGLTGLLLIAAGWSAREGRRSGGIVDHRFAVDRLVLAVVAIVALNAVLGGLLFATGAHVADPLHLLYGPAALVTAPIGWWFGGRTRAGAVTTRIRRDVWVAASAAVLLGIELRLFATG